MGLTNTRKRRTSNDIIRRSIKFQKVTEQDETLGVRRIAQNIRINGMKSRRMAYLILTVTQHSKTTSNQVYTTTSTNEEERSNYSMRDYQVK